MYCVHQEINNTTEELCKSCVQTAVCYHRRGDISHLEGAPVKPQYLGRMILLLAEHQGHTHSDWYKWNFQHYLSCDEQVELWS